MSILSEATAAIRTIGVPMETGIFKGKPPDEYVVLTPLYENFEVFADNRPEYETQGVRISLYSKKNPQQRKNQIVQALIERDITVTARKYVELEGDTGYHHCTIDAEKEYILQEE